MVRQGAHQRLGIEYALTQGHVYTLASQFDSDSLEAALAYDEVTQIEAEMGLSSLVELERSARH